MVTETDNTKQKPIEQKNLVKKYFENKRFISKFLGDEIISNYPCFNVNNDLYFYKNGYFQKDTSKEIEKIILKILGKEFTINKLRETVYYIKTKTCIKSEDLNKNHKLNLINLKNGMFNYKTNELLKHDPSYLSTYQINVKYNKDAKCLKIEKYLNEVLENNIHNLIYEVFGYSLIPTTKYQKCFILTGEGSNGKSVLLHLLGYFVGLKNISNVSFKNIDEHRFMLYQMKNKLINICADIGSQYIKETEIFKKITAGDPVEIETKGKAPEEITLYNKLIFSANKIPNTIDKTDGFLRRLIIIPFNNIIDEKKKILI